MADGKGEPLVFEGQQGMRSIVDVAAKYGIEIPPPIGVAV